HVLRAITKKLSSTEIIYPKYIAHEAHTICHVIDSDLPNSNIVKNVDSYKVFCRKDLHEHIIQLIRIHFSLHPLIPTENRSKFITLQELEQWVLWARSSTGYINILCSTMAIESHWRIIKHDYLSEYNNARLDLLVHIIIRSEDRMIPIKKKIIKPNPQRITNTQQWICSCLDFLLSRFFICKHLVQEVEPVPVGFFKKFTEQYDNPFENLPKNLLLTILNKSSNVHTPNQKAISNNNSNAPFQDNTKINQNEENMIVVLLPQYEDDTIELSQYEDDPINLLQDDTIECEESKKKNELYSLLEEVKTIIDENIQSPNAEKWINSIDKNFNSLRKMVNDCRQLNRQQKFPNTWEGRNHNTFWI
ncbi:9739_t:CDS:2, partial [Scutellospora calospora]